MTAAELAALSELEARATPGPWTLEVRSRVDGKTERSVWNLDCTPLRGLIAYVYSSGQYVERADADAALIAALRNAAPALLSEVSRFQARVRELEGALRHLIGCWDTEVPSHTLYAGFDNARTVLGEKEGT